MMELSIGNGSIVWNVTFTRTDNIIVGSFLTVTGIVSLFGNGLVLVIFGCHRHLRSPTNLLLANLAFIDLGMSSFGFPFAASSSFASQWLFGYYGCQWYAFNGMLFGYASIGSLTAISVDRYTSICKRNINKTQQYNYNALMISCAWVNAILWAVMPAVGWASYGLEPSNTACTIAWWNNDQLYAAYVITVTILCYIMPIAIICYCYGQAWYFIRRVGSGGAQENLEWTNEKDITKMCVACVILFLIAWTPYAIVCIWAIIGDPLKIPVDIAISPALFAKASAMFNPVVYVATNRQFRNGVKTLFTRNKNQRNPNDATQSMPLNGVVKGELVSA